MAHFQARLQLVALWGGVKRASLFLDQILSFCHIDTGTDNEFMLEAIAEANRQR